jgi:hypothetical protein
LVVVVAAVGERTHKRDHHILSEPANQAREQVAEGFEQVPDGRPVCDQTSRTISSISTTDVVNASS